ncbi:MAG: hypothetical protein LBH59_05910 [Planctomycetaceae bacterium]|jgi:flagellar hook-basal body complex protein FliE|nr:hypothetical protein [Planctomycetaceae bacterium]
MSGNRSQNDLRNFLVDQYDSWIYPNRKVLIGLILFVCVMLVVLFFVSHSNSNYKATAWNQYFKILDSPDAITPLEKFAEIKDGHFEFQASITAGQLLLSQACNIGFADKSQTTEKLNKALAMFQNVRDSRKASSKFKRQAALGAAQVREAMASVNAGSNDLDVAIDEYKKIVELWKNEYEAKIAQKQLDLLSRASTRKFYDRYATANIEPVLDPSEFKIEIDKNAPLVPNTNSSLLDDVFKDSTTPTTETPAEKPTEPTTPTTETPTEKPAEPTTPTIEPPTEKPAEPTTPTTDSPN